MWYDVKYACGHEGREQLFGPNKDRERRLAYLRTCRCPECESAAIRAEIARQAEADRSIGLPDLAGTDRQVARAQRIRQAFLQEHAEWCANLEKDHEAFAEDHSPEETAYEYNFGKRMLELAKKNTLSNTSASWWINDHEGRLQIAVVAAEKELHYVPYKDRQTTEAAPEASESPAAPEAPETPEVKNVVVESFESYNTRRYSTPWVAKVDQTGKPDFSTRVGTYTGSQGGAGDLVVFAPEQGQVYAYGQKDYKGNQTMRKWALWDGTKFVPCDRLGRVQTD